MCDHCMGLSEITLQPKQTSGVLDTTFPPFFNFFL